MEIYNSVVILDRITEKRFYGKLSILKDYLQLLRPVQVTEGVAVQRYESKPGSQVQMDWGICNYLGTRKRKRKVACFVMILGHSRTRYIDFCPCCDLAHILHCIVNAFMCFGGVPETLLTDRMKTVVNHTDPHETRLKLSHLPQKKDLKSFDFSFQPSLDEKQVRELATLNFVTQKENLVLLGPPGVGKSHLRMAICMEAIQKGMIVYFTTMDRLIGDISKADREERLSKRWKAYQRPDILIIDEMGYKALDQASGNLFFQLVCLRYEKGSMILTSNSSL